MKTNRASAALNPTLSLPASLRSEIRCRTAAVLFLLFYALQFQLNVPTALAETSVGGKTDEQWSVQVDRVLPGDVTLNRPSETPFTRVFWRT
jgi:hypothetical protein